MPKVKVIRDYEDKDGKHHKAGDYVDVKEDAEVEMLVNSGAAEKVLSYEELHTAAYGGADPLTLEKAKEELRRAQEVEERRARIRYSDPQNEANAKIAYPEQAKAMALRDEAVLKEAKEGLPDDADKHADGSPLTSAELAEREGSEGEAEEGKRKKK